MALMPIRHNFINNFLSSQYLIFIVLHCQVNFYIFHYTLYVSVIFQQIVIISKLYEMSHERYLNLLLRTPKALSTVFLVAQWEEL